jgi:hypothetical protein
MDAFRNLGAGFVAAINRWLADQKRQFSIKIPVQLAVGL